MPPKCPAPRSGCPVTNVLETLGDRWSLLVIRDLLYFNRHEFREFLESGEGVATNILSDRLKRLAEEGIIESIRHPENRRRKLYYLTEKGKSLFPLMRELVLWGHDNCPDSQAPEDRIERLRKHPKAVHREIMKNIAEWEAEFLQDD